jgi:hypothetical protein
MDKALDFFLSKHSIQESIDLLEKNIAGKRCEDIVMHHKQDMSFLHSIRQYEIKDDSTAFLMFIASKELSRSYRLYDKFCSNGNQEGADLILDDINYIILFMTGVTRYEKKGNSHITKREFAALHPERGKGELDRRAKGILQHRTTKSVYTELDK